MGTLWIYLTGPLRVSDDRGNDLTPKQARLRALLALLAEPPLRKRTRRWIVAHLWSDRPFEKSSMSLRNALHELRKVLGESGSAICADRSEIWIDPETVLVDLSKDGLTNTALPLLEGLDIPDAAFNDWLRDFRSQYSAYDESDEDQRPPMPQGLSVVTSVRAVASDAARTSAGIIADQVSQNLEDMVGSVRKAVRLGRGDFEIATHMSETAEKARLSAKVVHGPTDTILYTGYRELEHREGEGLTPQEVAEFSHTVAARALAKLPHVGALDREEIVAVGLAEVARRRLFSYRSGEVEAAGDLFDRAYDADPNGIFLAWRAFQKTALVIEGMDNRTNEVIEESEELLRRAAELAPESAQTHGLIALVRLMLFDDPSNALNSAEAGLRRNPYCLLSRQALAMTAGAFGEKDAAYRATSFCRGALANDDARHLWDLYHGLVCIATDRLGEALPALVDAARRCPSFKAPHRQLLALHVNNGAIEQARHHLARLEELEVGFTLEAYLKDPEYPVDTLRAKGLLNNSLEALY